MQACVCMRANEYACADACLRTKHTFVRSNDTEIRMHIHTQRTYTACTRAINDVLACVCGIYIRAQVHAHVFMHIYIILMRIYIHTYMCIIYIYIYIYIYISIALQHPDTPDK
jgi:hypothetical protein